MAEIFVPEAHGVHGTTKAINSTEPQPANPRVLGPKPPVALKAAGPTSKEWDALRSFIESLYIDYNLPLSVVQSHMATRHGFHAT